MIERQTGGPIAGLEPQAYDIADPLTDPTRSS
jgi:hypothetical protein